MQKPSLLQISFCISILAHVILVGALGISEFLAGKPSLERGNNQIILNLVAAPDKPVASSPPVKVVASVPPLPLEKPVEKPAPIKPVKQLSPPELPPVVPVPQLVQAAGVAPPPPQTQAVSQSDFHGDASSAKPGTDAVTMQQVQPDVAAKPDYLRNPPPVYPELARRRHEEGVVLLAVKVTAQGRAASVEIKKSSGFPLLDDAALAAVRDYEFEPARIGSLTFASEIEVPVHFELKKR